MGILDGGGSALLAGVFSPIYRDAKLRKATSQDDGYGSLTEAYAENDVDDFACKVQRDEFSSFYRTQANIPTSDVKFIMLLPSCTEAPEQNDILLYGGEEFRIVDIVSRDPVGASAVLRCSPNADSESQS